MYILLPAMKGATALMLLQAMEEMRQKYSGPQLAHHFVRFRTILRRSTTVSAQDKQIKDLLMYENLLQDPAIQELLARAELEGLRRTLMVITEARFPALAEMAQQVVVHLGNLDDLTLIKKMMASAPDEAKARWLLGVYAH